MHGHRALAGGEHRQTRMVSKPLTIAFQSRSRVEALDRLVLRENEMAKFALGDVVNSDKGRRGVVRAAFKSREGQQFYAVEKDGAMDFFEEERLTPAPRVELAA
jgi:hypothetical protein